MLDNETRGFMRQVAGLAPETLARIFDRALDLWQQGGRDASRAAKVSASQNSEIRRTVLTSFRPRAEELDAHQPELWSSAISGTVIAARGVLKRDRLTAEQYHVLMEPFVSAGMVTPEHPRAGIMSDDTATSADDRPGHPQDSTDDHVAVAEQMRARGLSTGSDYWLYVAGEPASATTTPVEAGERHHPPQ
ncbi:hypothetical protein ACH4T9_27675 [Micromonospora sp. NPDC020750]|uniref:hypothetical protein n=1 Tax=unclassified Micromonospora TaxID=2617518 RepID=UPI0037B3A91B